MGEVQLVKQLRRARCEQGESWGLYRNSVWVKDGCRGVFCNVSQAGRGAHAVLSTRPGGGTAAQLQACNVRARDTGILVTQVPVNDSVTEMIIDYRDGNYVCMVRTDATVQSLTLLRRKR